MNKGWICPKCGSVYAPWVEKCEKCCGAYKSWPAYPVPVDPGNTTPSIFPQPGNVPWPGYPHPYVGDPLPGQIPSSIIYGPPPSTTYGPISMCRN
jgi:hypothetical protein